MHDSMLNSKRIFDKMHLKTHRLDSLETFWKVRNICRAKGSGIKELSWEFARLTRVEIVAILNLLPNLQKLSCRDWIIKADYYDDPPEPLELQCLTDLSIDRRDSATYEFFSEFLSHDFINKLHLEVYHNEFIQRQKNVTNLELQAERIDNEWISLPLEHLKLSLQMYRNIIGDPVLGKIIRQQVNLISLDISDCTGIFDNNSEAFSVVCDLKHLKSLKMNVDELISMTFRENFDKLCMLEELWIGSVEHDVAHVIDIVEYLSKTKMERLASFKLELARLSVPIDRILSMGQNYPKLTSFYLNCVLPLPVQIYLKNLPNLNKLEIVYDYCQEFSLICSNLEDSIFPKISSIDLHGFNFRSEIEVNERFLMRLVNVLPNLSRLRVETCVPLSINFLKSIKEKLPKLKHLEGIEFTEKDQKFDVNFINYLKLISKSIKISTSVKLKTINMNLQDLKDSLEKDDIKLMRAIRDINGIEIVIRVVRN